MWHFTTNIIISLLLTPVIIILLEIYRKSKKDKSSVYLDAVPTSDLFVRCVLGCFPLKKFHIAPAFFWFIISVSIGIIIPFIGMISNLPNPSDYFFTKSGFFLTFNFTFIVPLLFSAHFHLHSIACKFLDNRTLSDLGFITHNKKTMETADCLFGVTLSEDGSSKMVSVKIEGGGDNGNEMDKKDVENA